MPIGLIEAFALAQEFGARCLDTDEILWLAGARRRRGCRSVKDRLTVEDRQRVIELGARCKKWKEENQ